MERVMHVEFVHLDGTGEIYSLLTEGLRRLKDDHELARAGIESSSSIKTVVRFIDTGEFHAQYFERISRLENKKLFFPSYWITNRFLFFFYSLFVTLVEKRIMKEKWLCRTMARISFEVAAENGAAVILSSDRKSFRYVSKNEVFDLTTKIKRAKVTNVYLLNTHDLFALEAGVTGSIQ